MVRKKWCARFLLIFFWINIICLTDLQAVKILKLVVPDIIQDGVHDSVVLDCDYNLSNDTSGLMVKWFYKNKTRPVYQWIVPQKPQDMGTLRGRVDLNYKASSDPFKMHRAIKIIKPSIDNSGDYTCVVSTFMEEDQMTKTMIVFVPETKFRLIQNKSDDASVNVICVAEGVFPEPSLTLATPRKRLESTSISTQLLDGRFSTTTQATVLDRDLPLPTEFVCTLRILQANYSVRKESIYYPGPMSTTPYVVTAADMQLAAAVGSTGNCVCLNQATLAVFIAYIVLFVNLGDSLDILKNYFK